MALAKHKAEWPVNSVGVPLPVGGDVQRAVNAPSPARALQQLLDERTAQVSDGERWSRRRQLVFIVASTCALWAAILELTAQAVRAIA